MTNSSYNQAGSKSTQVLLVNLEGRISGAEQSLLLLYRYLRSDLNISVSCPSPGPLSSKLNQLRGRVYSISSPPRKSHCVLYLLLYFMLVSLQIIRIVFKTRPAIIHANNLKAAIASIPAAFLSRRKLICHARDLSDVYPACKICSFFCCRIIAVSNSVKDFLLQQGVKASKIDVIYNGTEVNNQSKIQNESHRRTFTFANIGQFVPWKKQYLFIEAAEHFTSRGGVAQFLLIGNDIFGRDKKYKAELLKQIKNIASAAKVIWVDWVSDTEKFWPKIDCLVHTAEREPFGRVIIEAMAHKVPVIAINRGGPGEIIEHGRTGLLVSEANPEELSSAMLTISCNKKLAESLLDSGYEEVVSHFTADKTAADNKQIYQQFLTV